MGFPTSRKVREKWGTVRRRKIDVKSGGRGRLPYMARWINLFNMAYKVF